MQINPTNDTNNIDLILTLHSHGWSTCKIFNNGSIYEMVISHVFGEPYTDFINSLTKLINGSDKATFFWYREPGGEKIEINRLIDKKEIHIDIFEFRESFGEDIKNFEKTLEFEIKLKNFIILAYLQLKKTFLLLKDKDFAKDRQKDFPFNDFIKFEEIVKIYLAIA